MQIRGYLKDFCLSEIFQFIHTKRYTGLLTIRTENTQHIGFFQGQIVSVTNSLDGQGLISMIAQRRWLNEEDMITQFQSCPANILLGVWLKTQNILQAEQLKLLFHAQVLRQICAMFKLENGYFEFHPNVTLLNTEMTGLSLGVHEATLLGLRVLRDWMFLTDKLPDSTSALAKAADGKPSLQLDSLEWQVWEFVDGQTSLEAIAEQLHQPVEKIQQVAFRLISVDLAKEVFPIFSPANVEQLLPDSAAAGSNDSKLSSSFFQNLLSFLKSKV